MKKLLKLVSLLLAVLPLHAWCQQINPASQINWPTACTQAGYYYSLAAKTCTPPGNTVVENAHTVLAGPTTGSALPTFRQLSLDEILPAFSISSFGCDKCGSYEIGQTVTSPVSFTASYSSVPSSANVSDGTNSVALASPYTSGSLAQSYVSSSQSATTFTLTAVAATTKTAAQTIQWLPRTFAGTGTAGATGATASGSSAALAGATGTLASPGLGNQGAYGPYSPSGQKIYILMIGGSHTFTSGGFAFPMNTPTAVSFVNQFGATVSMYLYESTNSLSATFTVTVAS